MNSWSDIPEHLIEKFAENLHNPKDFVNFGAVYKLWNSVFRNNFQHPLLLLFHKDGAKTHNVFHVTQEKAFEVSDRIYFPELENIRILGSSRGWLLTCIKKTNRVNLVNPYKRTQIPLPPLPRVPDICLRYKVSISSDPTSNSDDFQIMVINSWSWDSYFCKIGDEQWTTKQVPIGLQDVISHNGHFYAIDFYHDLYKFNITTKNHQIAMNGNYNGRANHGIAKYLVESNGELFLLVALKKYEKDAFGFDIFKLDIDQEIQHNYHYIPFKRKLKVTDIGNRALFIGCKGCVVSLDLSVYKGFKRNCVYFVHCEKIYVFNLKDESLESVSTSLTPDNHRSAIWLSPNP